MDKRKRVIPIVISFLIFYFSLVLLPRDYTRYYKIGINCGIVVKVNKNSEYKTQPSILVSINGNNFEIIQYENFDYDFRMIKVGDKICKEPSSHDFVIIKENGEMKLVKAGFYNNIIAWLFWKPNRPIIIEKMKSDCQCW